MLVSSARAWILDGDPPRAWQTVNQFGFVTGLLKIQGDDKQEASTWHTVCKPGIGAVGAGRGF